MKMSRILLVCTLDIIVGGSMDLKISRISATLVNSDRTGEWRLMLHAWSFANNRQFHGVIQNYWVSAFVDCAPEQIRIERQKYWRIKGTRMSIYIRIIIVDKRAVSSANRLVMTNRYHARDFSRCFVHKNVKVSLSNAFEMIAPLWGTKFKKIY